MTKAYESLSGMRYEPEGGVYTGIFADAHRVDIHTYGGVVERAWFAEIPHAEFVKMINALPGYTATYTPPRRKNVDVVRDLPAGSVFKWDDMKPDQGFYIRQRGDRVTDSDNWPYTVDNFNHGEDGAIVVIYNPEEDSE
jgi:hypothetical protein